MRRRSTRPAWLELSPVRRAAGGTVLAGVASQALVAISGIVSARMLGPEDRGYLALLVTFPSVVAQAGSLGISLALTHYIARLPAAALTLLRSQATPVAVQILVLTGVHSAVALGYAVGKPEHVVQAAVVSLVAVPGLYFVEYGLAVLQGRREFRSLNLWRLAPSLGYVLGLLAIVASGSDSLVLVTGAAVGSSLLIGAVIIVVAARRVYADAERQEPGAAPRVPSRREVFRFGTASYLGYVSPLDSFRLDQLLVGFILGPAKLGLYVVAVAFMNLPRFIGHSLGLVAAPHLAATQEREAVAASARRFLLAATVACGAIALVIAATLQWLLPLLFGEAFEDAVGAGRVLLLAAFFLGVRRVAADCARGAGFPALGSVAELASLGVFAIAGPVLASTSGLLGVAWALTAASFVGWAALLLAMRRRMSDAGAPP